MQKTFQEQERDGMKSFTRVWLSISLIAIGIGLGLIIIAAGAGAKWIETSTCSLDKSYDGVESIHMDISYGNVKIIQGDKFSITADRLPKNQFESYVKDGTWYMKEKDMEYAEVFGIHIPVRFFPWGDDTSDITITVPEGFTAKQFTMKVGAGRVEAEAISTMDGDFTIGAGRLEADQMTVSNQSRYKIGAGEMILQDADLNNITLENKVGNTEIDGRLTGKNTVQCNIGNITLNLDGDRKDYSYDATASGIGKVDIDGDIYRNINSKNINNNVAENNLILDCNIGNISIDFN